MQIKKDNNNKNLLCLSFHMPCSQNVFYLYGFFSLGLVLLVWLSNFMITLIWSCIQLPDCWEWATRVSFYNPLKLPETLFRFCISAPTSVTLVAIYFLKRGLGLLFSFTLFYFIIIFHFHFYTFKTSKKIIEKFCKNYSTNDVLIESNFWLNKILAMYLIRKGVEINEKRAFNPTAKSTWTHAGATILTSTHTGPYSFKPAVVSR